MKGKLILFSLIFLIFFDVNSQDSTSSLNVSAFVDAYYAYDFGKPLNNEKPGFFYNHNRHNELSINMALISLQYQAEKTRGAVSLMTGTYPQYNLAHEQDLMKNIFEAYGGVMLYNDLWLEAGVFGSHLGFESAISTQNITLTRSLMAENSPYYLSGAKLIYEGLEKWTFLFVVSNGWQNISEPWFNENKALGSQIVFTPNDKISFNYSNWWSDEATKTFSATRIFNDFYTIINPTDKLKVIVAFDYGMQENFVSGDWDIWYAPALLLGYDFHDKFGLGLRGEYYSDENQVNVSTGTEYGLEVLGTSLNIDYKPTKKAYLRVEGKWLNNANDIFITPENQPTNTNFAITTSLAVNFE